MFKSDATGTYTKTNAMLAIESAKNIINEFSPLIVSCKTEKLCDEYYKTQMQKYGKSRLDFRHLP